MKSVLVFNILILHLKIINIYMVYASWKKKLWFWFLFLLFSIVGIAMTITIIAINSKSNKIWCTFVILMTWLETGNKYYPTQKFIFYDMSYEI